MTEPISTSSHTREVRWLTIVTCILGVLTIINIGISLFGGLCLWLSLYGLSLASRIEPYVDKYAHFDGWPLEQQIQQASVIAIARYNKQDGVLKCMITEILKQTQGTAFYYKVGDEYREGTEYLAREDVSYGDGLIIFFTGSPATMRYSCSFEGNRVAALGDMPLDTLRETVRKAK